MLLIALNRLFDRIIAGIPRESDVLRVGDKLAIDVSLYMNGFHGDNCATIIVGHSRAIKEADSAEIRVKKQLILANVEALDAAIAACAPGKCITDIGAAIQKVAEKYKFETIREFCGHGLGRSLHMQPLILHYPHSEKHSLLPGMIFTIEPIFCEKSSRIAVDSEDNWSAFTLDGGGSAQFEHEVLITEDGAEILTLPQ
jgi:methionyl aminopeptidase